MGGTWATGEKPLHFVGNMGHVTLVLVLGLDRVRVIMDVARSDGTRYSYDSGF